MVDVPVRVGLLASGVDNPSPPRDPARLGALAQPAAATGPPPPNPVMGGGGAVSRLRERFCSIPTIQGAMLFQYQVRLQGFAEVLPPQVEQDRALNPPVGTGSLPQPLRALKNPSPTPRSPAKPTA
jgi:hypothetical protein